MAVHRPGLVYGAASAALALAGTACAQAKTDEMRGTVELPAGQDSRGTWIITCPEPFDNCDRDGRKTAVIADATARNRGWWRVTGLDPRKRYQVVAHKDLDGDNDASAGDLLGGIDAGAGGTRPGSASESIVLTMLRPREAPATVSAPSAGSGQSAGGLAGRWAQRSSATETMLVSKLKLVPRTGGGVGMDTRSVTEYAPVRVDRAMALELRPDGSFTWSIELRKPHGQGCFMTSRQEKRGRASLSGGSVTFATSGGTQSTTNSCTGRTDTAPAPAMSETYAFSRAGGSLRLTGTGGVDWRFTGG